MYQAQVTPDHIGEVFEMGVLSVGDPFWAEEDDFEREINRIRDNPSLHCSTDDTFNHPSELRKDSKDVRNHYGETYDEAPACPYCGTKRGFAFGTGDCGCEVDPE
jgi:hypothetical protein